MGSLVCSMGCCETSEGVMRYGSKHLNLRRVWGCSSCIDVGAWWAPNWSVTLGGTKFV